MLRWRLLVPPFSLLDARTTRVKTPLGAEHRYRGLFRRPPTLVAHRHPSLASITSQIGQVFPRGPLLVEALAREAIIVGFWDSPARQGSAGRGVVRGLHAEELPGDEDRRWDSEHQHTGGRERPGSMRCSMGVGLEAGQPAAWALLPPAPTSAWGSADGTSTGTTTVKTNSGIAAGNFQGNAWGQPTVVTIFRLSDNPHLDTQNQANQFAPFFDINASNADNSKAVNGSCSWASACRAR